MSSDALEAQGGDNLLVATFMLGESAFGVDTARVQEVVRMGDITPVHHAPNHVVGIRNLRGRIVTVLDLRARLQLGSAEVGPDSRILIVESQGDPVGLLVDRVADTIAVDPARLEPPPPNLHGVQGRHLRGVCHGGDRLVALLDPSAVIEPDARSAQLPARETVEA
jgi:purine-binding chemotaxis protein CheW